MKTTFTKQYILDNRGCYSEEQVQKLSFINNTIITLANIINSEIPNKDKFYFIWTTCNYNSDKRKENYNNSIIIQNILSTLGWSVDSYDCSDFIADLGYGFYSIIEQNQILNEILIYSKQFE